MDVVENLKFCQSKQPNFLTLPKPAVIGFKTKLQLFYFVFNNYLCIRGILELRSELFGKAFENWAYHELQTFNTGAEARWELSLPQEPVQKHSLISVTGDWRAV